MTYHLAILHEPYLSRILRGEKTVESRWLRRRVAPYDRVAVGDTIYLKRASGPVVATARAAEIWQFDDLTPERVDALLVQFGDALWLDADFAAHARGQRYAVLITLAEVRLLPEPLLFCQRGRSGWIVLEEDLVASCQQQ